MAGTATLAAAEAAADPPPLRRPRPSSPGSGRRSSLLAGASERRDQRKIHRRRLCLDPSDRESPEMTRKQAFRMGFRHVADLAQINRIADRLLEDEFDGRAQG